MSGKLREAEVFSTRPLAPPGDAMHRRLLPPEVVNECLTRGGASKAVRSKAEPWNESKHFLRHFAPFSPGTLGEKGWG
jgi:hypothetical protein